MARPRKHLPLLEQLAAEGQRRICARRDFDGEVILEDEYGDPLLRLPAENLSVSGVYLKGRFPMRVGACAFLAFHLPTTDQPLRLVGEVVRVSRDDDDCAAPVDGVGMRFIELNLHAREALRQYVGA